MRGYVIKVVISTFTCLTWGAFTLAIAASDGSQQSTTGKSSPDTECLISEAAQDAIDRAWNLGEKNLAAMELLKQAEEAAMPPECDSIRAKILAEKAIAITLQRDEDSTSDQSEDSSIYDVQEQSQGCPKFDYERLSDPEVLPFITTSFPLFFTGTTLQEIQCSDANESAYLRIQQHRLVKIAKYNLALEMASSGGEYFAALAYLQGCPAEAHDYYAKIVRSDFSQIIPEPKTDSQSILNNLDAKIAKDPYLAKRCITGS